MSPEFELTGPDSTTPSSPGCPPRSHGLQWHGAEVRRVPDGGVVLAANPDGHAQAIRVGPVAWGVQFHVEVSSATVTEWAAVPAYRRALAANGHSVEWLAASVEEHLEAMALTTERLAQGLLDAVDARPEAVVR